MTTATAPSTRTTPTSDRRRGVHVALWALQVLLVAVYAFSAVGKLSLDPATVAGFDAMGLGATGAVIIGGLELLGAVGLLIPRLAGLAATALTALMIGAVIAMTAIGGGVLVVIPASVLVLVATVAWARRRETAALVRDPRRVLLG